MHDTYVFQGVLERNESKILHFQLELLETKAEFERKLSEKEEEVETLRYGYFDEQRFQIIKCVTEQNHCV